MPKVEIRIPSVLDFLHPPHNHVHEADKPGRATSSPIQSPGAELRPRGRERLPEAIQTGPFGASGLPGGYAHATSHPWQSVEAEIRDWASEGCQQMAVLLLFGWHRVRPELNANNESIRPAGWGWRRSPGGTGLPRYITTQSAFEECQRIRITAAVAESVTPSPPTTSISERLVADGWVQFYPTTESEWQTPERVNPPQHFFSTSEAHHAFLCGVAVVHEVRAVPTPLPLPRTSDPEYQARALRSHGWTQVQPPLPVGASLCQTMSYYWRRPGVGNRRRGRMFRSTQQAYNQLRRDNSPIPLQPNGQPPPF